jgi:vancomycin resistance protein YoaR
MSTNSPWLLHKITMDKGEQTRQWYDVRWVGIRKMVYRKSRENSIRFLWIGCGQWCDLPYKPLSLSSQTTDEGGERMKRLGIIFVLCFVCGCSLFQQVPKGTKPHEGKPQQSSAAGDQREPADLILKYKEKEWRLDLYQIGYDGVDPTTIDRGAFDRWLSTVEKSINRPPQSATFKNRVLYPHKNGRRLDRDELDHWLDHIHEYVNHPMEAPVQIWRPHLTTQELSRIKEKQLASYTTFYHTSNVYRTHNIELSVQAIDHHVVDVGEIFSFNRVVGPRTINRGYKPAPVIVKGEYTEGIGGGICQTSSTLFNCVDRAGLRILQRVSHSKQVTYVPAGRDATVSWGGPDFQFQNQLNNPILVVASAKNGRLTIALTAAADTEYTPHNIPKPPVTRPKTERVPAPEKKQPLNEKAKEYNRAPLPPIDLKRDTTQLTE